MKTNLTPTFLYHEVTERLLARLPFMRINPTRILVQGNRDDRVVSSLQQRFTAAIIETEMSEACQGYDLIVSLLALPQHVDHAAQYAALQAWHALLNPGGLLLFAALGPDTFKEFTPELLAVCQPRLQDMHEVGDWLLQIGFELPVMDRDCLTFAYDSAADCHEECQEEWGSWGVTMAAVETQQTSTEASFEIVYGQAWKGNRPIQNSTETRIPISSIQTMTIKGRETS